MFKISNDTIEMTNCHFCLRLLNNLKLCFPRSAIKAPDNKKLRKGKKQNNEILARNDHCQRAMFIHTINVRLLLYHLFAVVVVCRILFHFLLARSWDSCMFNHQTAARVISSSIMCEMCVYIFQYAESSSRHVNF